MHTDSGLNTFMGTKKSKKDEETEALIFTPISIARARHASTHGPSVVDKNKSPKKKQKVNQSKSATSKPSITR